MWFRCKWNRMRWNWTNFFWSQIVGHPFQRMGVKDIELVLIRALMELVFFWTVTFGKFGKAHVYEREREGPFACSSNLNLFVYSKHVTKVVSATGICTNKKEWKTEKGRTGEHKRNKNRLFFVGSIDLHRMCASLNSKIVFRCSARRWWKKSRNRNIAVSYEFEFVNLWRCDTLISLRENLAICHKHIFVIELVQSVSLVVSLYSFAASASFFPKVNATHSYSNWQRKYASAERERERGSDKRK